MWQPKNLTPEQREERRFAALPLLKAGRLSQAQIARRLGVSRQAVNRWVHRLAQEGRDALKRRAHSGRPSRLTKQQWADLLVVLEQGAQAAGFPTQRWTLVRIQQVVQARFDVRFSPHYLGERLRRLGWSVQKPQPAPREREDALVEAWLKGDWPQIKKCSALAQTAQARTIQSQNPAWRARIVFIDEVGFSFLDKLATTWAPKGQTPVLVRTSARRVLSTVVALTTDARLLKRHFDHAITGADIIVALRHFRRYLPGPLILVWDRLSAHRDRQVQQWTAADPDLYVEWLPPYAPDLNPEEGCNDNIKNAVRNATPENVEELRRMVDRAFNRLRKRADILQSFFQHARLDGVNLIT